MMNKRVSFSKKIQTRTIDEIDRQSEESRSDEESRQFNKFQLLNLVDGAESIEKDEDDNMDEAIHSDEDATSGQDKLQRDSSKQSRTKSSKKSRKKKNKRVNVQSADIDANEFDIGLVSKGALKQELKDENRLYQEYNQHVKLLKVDVRSLLPENELKKIWGKGVVREDRSRSLGHGGQRSRFVNLRFSDFRQFSLSTIPRMEPDDFLNEMQLIKEQGKLKGDNQTKPPSKRKGKNDLNSTESLFNSDFPVYFKFVHDKEYQAAQKEFVQAVHMAHPEAIVHNLSIYPNHAESLVQLSHIIRLSEDYKQASEIIERALVTFERGFHNRFNLATAQSRLSYRRPENRTFFIVLFEQIMSCHRRGLRKTPFEYSKLLLSLEPDNDPMLATQLLDFFALRSEEYDFLINFYNSWWQVQKLPNMNFSLAMAYYSKSKCAKQSKTDNDKLLKLADEQLQKSLLIFPNFILSLLEACSCEPSSELKKCAYFDYSPYGTKYKTVPEILEVLVELYVKRSFGLWKQKQTMSWLEKNVACLVNKFATGELEDDGKRVMEHWAQFKKISPKNLLRHIALCDLKIKMPASASVSTFLAIDPFPPTDAIITYHSSLHQTTRPPISNRGGTGLTSLFLRSFLPSFSVSSDQQRSAGEQTTSGTTISSTTTTNARTSEGIDTNQEIALGNFVMDELDNAPGLDLSAVQNSIRELATSMSSMINMLPMIRDQRENLNNAAGEARERGDGATNDENRSTEQRRDQSHDGDQ